MIVPLAKFIDWYLLQALAMLLFFQKHAGGDSKLASTKYLMNCPYRDESDLPLSFIPK